MIDWTLVIAAFACSFVASLSATIFLLRSWRFQRGVDAGDGIRKQQERPILRIGGVTLYGAFVMAYLVANFASPGEADSLIGFPFLAIGSALFFLGFLDDLVGLPTTVKLVVQVVVGLAAYLCGMRIEMVTNPFLGESVAVGGVGILLTMGWFVALPNLINLIDGMDGLAGGVGLFLTLTLAVLGAATGNVALLLLSACFLGGILAFLCFNLPPAKIYMGDGGAYLLGFFIAATSLITSNKGSVFGALLVVIIALGFPILDTALAIVRRAFAGLPVTAPDARHIHHRLLVIGLSKRTILLVLYGIFAGLSLLGLSLFFFGGHALAIVGMALTIGIILFVRAFGVPQGWSELRWHLADIVHARRDIRYAYTLSQVLEHDLDRVDTGDQFWERFRGYLSRLGISPPPEGGRCGAGKCLVVYPLSDAYAWTLCCPAPKVRRRQWDRVIRCFVPVLMEARSTWGDPPFSVGVQERNREVGVRELEERLNAGTTSADDSSHFTSDGSSRCPI